MTVLILERVPPGLRGELSKWMLEVGTGVFVGRMSGLVREKLWKRCELEAYRSDGSALIIWRTNTAQGFAVETANSQRRHTEEIDGMWLVRVDGPQPKTSSESVQSSDDGLG